MVESQKEKDFISIAILKNGHVSKTFFRKRIKMKYLRQYDEINAILTVCYTNHGCVFGGYVRDYLLSADKAFYRNIDLWFRDIDHLKMFLKQCKNLIKTNGVQIISKKWKVPFKIFYNKENPCEDFHVNACYYDGDYMYTPDILPKEMLLKSIRKKKCFLSEKYKKYIDLSLYKTNGKPFSYITILKYPIIYKILNPATKRIKYMIENGWKIYVPYQTDIQSIQTYNEMCSFYSIKNKSFFKSLENIQDKLDKKNFNTLEVPKQLKLIKKIKKKNFLDHHVDAYLQSQIHLEKESRLV